MSNVYRYNTQESTKHVFDNPAMRRRYRRSLGVSLFVHEHAMVFRSTR